MRSWRARDVRELAHGTLPSVLTRGGLRPGVEALPSGVPLSLTIDVAAEPFETERVPTRLTRCQSVAEAAD